LIALLSLPVAIGAKAIVEALLTAVTDLETSVLTELMKDVLSSAGAATDIGLGRGDWFLSVSHLLFPIEELLVAPLLFAATIGAIAHQDVRRLARAWAVGLPLSLIGGYAIVQLVRVGIGATDAMSSMVQQQVAPDLERDFLDAVTIGAAHASSTGPVGALIGLVVIGGGLALWLELALRAAAVELAVYFMPLALAGLVWPATAHWAKRLLELLGALLLAKPVVVGALCLGANALTSARAGPSSMVTGAAILLLAAFAPMVLLKLVPIVEVSAIAHLQGVSRQPLRAAERAAQRAAPVVAGAATGGGAAVAGPCLAEDLGSAGQLLAQVGAGAGSGEHPLGPARPCARAADSGRGERQVTDADA
jgi:hypothetical protein